MTDSAIPIPGDFVIVFTCNKKNLVCWIWWNRDAIATSDFSKIISWTRFSIFIESTLKKLWYITRMGWKFLEAYKKLPIKFHGEMKKPNTPLRKPPCRYARRYMHVWVSWKCWYFFTSHCNPVQGSTGFCREIPVMKTGSLQWEQGSL